jgi:hypothetical protein
MSVVGAILLDYVSRRWAPLFSCKQRPRNFDKAIWTAESLSRATITKQPLNRED